MKKFNLKKRISKSVANMAGYTPGEQPKDIEKWVKLNTNEFPFPPSPKVVEAIKNELGKDGASLRLYPNPESSKLREQLGKYFGVPARVRVRRKRLGRRPERRNPRVLRRLPPDCHPRPQLLSLSRPRKITGLQARPDSVQKEHGNRFRQNLFLRGEHLFLHKPQRPHGVGFDCATVEKIAAGFDGIVLVDEAYAPFADYSCVPLVEKYPNLIVTGTSSKGLGLAGMRIGWAFANPAIIEVLDRVRDSYNLDRLAQAAGIAALADAPYYAQKCGAVIAERESVEKFFDKLGWQYHKSSANFVFFRPNKNGKKGAKVAADLFEFMRGKKILMRYFPTQKKIADGIRLSIGTAAQMKLFKKAALEWAQK